ncbi:MAG: oligosaccharide flippase family protein [Pseudomonadota bacterium]|nr:oligosaccharide flippase family protein [Pseudomonadota bacterium]
MNRRQYLSQFLALFTGTVLAQLFNLGSYPLLSRLYGPADFGLFGTFVAAAAIPGAIACGRFELAIAITPEAGRRSMLWLCYSIALGVALAATCVVSIYWWRVATPDLGILAPLLFAAVFLTGVVNSTTMYLMRHESFRFASSGVVTRTATAVLTQIGLAFIWRSPLGLIAGFCLGLAAQACLAVYAANRAHPLGRPERVGMTEMFRRFRPQVSVDLPGSMLATLSFNLIPFALQALYGIRAVGFFSLGQRLAVLPLQLFNDSLSQVFFQRAARAQEERGEFWQEYRFTLICAGLISMVMLAGLLIFAKPVTVFYLGPRWALAGTILVILAPMLAMRSVAMSLATSVFVLRRPAWLLFLNMASVMAIVVTFGVTRFNGANLLGFMKMLAILQGAEYAIFALLVGTAVYRASRRSERVVAEPQG